MTLRELRYIVAVADALSFRRAAEQCFATQPTVSIAIRKVEDEIGYLIFEREPGVTVTERGAQFVGQAKKVLEEAALLKPAA